MSQGPLIDVSQFSSVMFNSLWPHWLWYARLPCLSPTPGTYSNSCPLSQWCHPTISSIVIPFSCSQSFPASGFFQMSQLFIWGGLSIWPLHAKSWLIGKDSDARRDWGQEKGMTEDEMVGWHHWLNGHEFEWTLGDGDGQGGLACYNSWGRKESDMTEWLNWTDWSIGASASASVLPMNSQDWFPLGLTGFISLQLQEHSKVICSSTVPNPQFFGIKPSFSKPSVYKRWSI